MSKHHTAISWVLPCASVAAVILLFFWLPYHVPVRPSVSDSYLFGFNNRICWLIFLTLLGLLILIGGDLFQPVEPDTPLGPATLRKALAGSFIASASMYLWTRKLNGYDEALYLIDRLRLVLEGRVPYRDFEYAYGAGLLYVPAGLARALHLGAADAYGLFYVLVALTGTWLLHLCLRWMEGSSAAKRRTFWFLWSACFAYTLNFGVNYALLRFVLPVFWMLSLQRAVRAQATSPLLPFVWAVAGYLVLLLVSPELAVAQALGSAIYLAYHLFRTGYLRLPTQRASYVAMLLLFAAITASAFHLGVFQTMLAFRTGGFNFPVIPAPHILLFLLAAGLLASRAGTLLRTGDDGPALPLLCLGVLASAAVLGRCDPGHVLLNGLPFFLFAGVLSGGLRQPWRLFVPLLWFVFLLIPIVPGAPYIVLALRQAALPATFTGDTAGHLQRWDQRLFHRLQRQFGPEPAAQGTSASGTGPRPRRYLDLDTLFAQPAGTVFQAPFGFSVTHFGRYHSAQVDEGYFFAPANVVTPEQIQRRVDELRQHPARPLLLPDGLGSNSCHVSADGERAAISSLFAFPYRATAVHEESLSEPYCLYLQQHYRLLMPADAQHFGYALWTPLP